MKKDDIVTLTIEDIGNDGEGIGHADGMAFFVKDALPGDTIEAKVIKVKKNLAFGRLIEIKSPSPHRTPAACPNARPCGGCTMMHMDYAEQLRFKRNKVINCLVRIGGLDKDYVESIMEAAHGMNDADGNSTPYRYRNKMQFPVGRDRNGEPVMGFYAGRTHHIIPLDDCITGHPVNRFIIEAVKKYINDYSVSVYDEENGTGLLRHIITRIGFSTGELMVTVVANGSKLPNKEELVNLLSDAVSRFNMDSGQSTEIKLVSVMLSINTENTNRILGNESRVLHGNAFITDYIGDTAFHISAESFYQVNPVMTRRLYGKALEYAALTGAETVWDMYCGIGTISLFLAKHAGKVYGVEIVPEAIRDAKENAKLNGIDNASFYVGKAEELAPQLISESDGEDNNPDVVVVDPPRKGCDVKLLETISLVSPKRIVYVSCDPATLARDIKYLREHGYELQKAGIYDQFCHSSHVETIALIERVRNAKDFVQIGIDAEEYYRIKDEEKTI